VADGFVEITWQDNGQVYRLEERAALNPSNVWGDSAEAATPDGAGKYLVRFEVIGSSSPRFFRLAQ
jgi:hypothetical protein